MGIKRLIQNRLLASAKPFERKGTRRPKEEPQKLVGLVLCLGHISELYSIRKIQKNFVAQGALCHLCIYLKDKKMSLPPDMFDEDTVLINRDATNWYGLVRPEFAEFFERESFDIVIDLSKEYFFSTTYLVSKSKALLKVGRFVHPKGPFHLVLGSNCPHDDDAFIELLNSSLQFIRFG